MPSPLKRKIRLKRNHELPLFILTTANQPLLICYKETCIASMSLPTSQFQQHHLNHQEARGPAMPLRLRDNKCMSFLRENLLTLLTIIGVLAGTLLGWGLRATGVEWSRRDVMYFQYPGELFLRMLKCLIVPLLVSSIVSAIGSLDLSLSGKWVPFVFIYSPRCDSVSRLVSFVIGWMATIGLITQLNWTGSETELQSLLGSEATLWKVVVCRKNQSKAICEEDSKTSGLLSN